MRSFLVIDSNPELRSFVAGILRRAGHFVRETHDVQLAGAIIRADRVDVVVTDLVLQNRANDETLERLRGEFPMIEVIAISAAPHATGYLRLAAALGGPRTLAQPFLSRELMGLITEMLAGVAAYAAAADHRSRSAPSQRN